MFVVAARPAMLHDGRAMGYSRGMETANSAAESVLAEAQRVNEERLQAISDLAESIGHRMDLEAQLTEAHKREKQLIAAAEKQGWTPAQIKRFSRTAKAPKKSSGGGSPAPTPATGEDYATTE